MTDLSPPDLRYEYYALTDGAKLRYAVVEPEGAVRGTILLLQGRREFIEKKYLEAGRDMRARGFRLICFDWRGQGLSSRFFEGEKRQYDHMTDFGMLTADLHAFYHDVVVPRCTGPLIPFAHSLGALVAAHWLAEEKPNVKAAIFTAPALSIGVPAFSGPIARLMLRRGKSECYAVGQHDYDNHDRRFIGNVLSHDRERFSVIEKYFDGNPELRVGGVTWDWLNAVLAAIAKLRQRGYLERIGIPVLGLFGGRDIVTPSKKDIALLRRIPRAEAYLIPGALHDLMNEADRYRGEAWGRIDEFLESCAD